MKGTLHLVESGWEVWYATPRTDNQNGYYLGRLPLHLDTFNIAEPVKNIVTCSEGLEVEFEIIDHFDNNGPEHFKKFAKIII